MRLIKEFRTNTYIFLRTHHFIKLSATRIRKRGILDLKKPDFNFKIFKIMQYSDSKAAIVLKFYDIYKKFSLHNIHTIEFI